MRRPPDSSPLDDRGSRAAARPRRSRRILVAIYLGLWLLTATAGAGGIAARLASRFGSLTRVETTAPGPFVVHVDLAYDHALGAGDADAWYVWLPGWSHELHHGPRWWACEFL